MLQSLVGCAVEVAARQSFDHNSQLLLDNYTVNFSESPSATDLGSDTTSPEQTHQKARRIPRGLCLIANPSLTDRRWFLEFEVLKSC
jgi:hypothetical protein